MVQIADALVLPLSGCSQCTLGVVEGGHVYLGGHQGMGKNIKGRDLWIIATGLEGFQYKIKINKCDTLIQ
jgi:hypothetical protein